MDKPLIYVVDEDQKVRNSIQALLDKDYAPITFDSGNAALESFSTNQPDIMLLEPRLPDQDGYEICKKIREMDPEDKTAIIFITGKDTLDERMRSYYVGCDDFLAKPIENNELVAKLEKVKRYQSKNRDLKAQQNTAQDMAFQAMTEASQYGMVLQFIKQTFTTETPTELASSAFQVLSKLNLSGSIQLRLEDKTLSLRSAEQACNPIEEEIFELLKNRGRIFDFQNKTVFNDHHVSIMIKDMPLDDEVMYGRLRDVLAAVVEGVESRLMDFKRKNALYNVMNDIRSTMATMEVQFREHETQTVETMEKLMLKMENGFQFLDLTEEQESFFMGLIEESMQKLVALYMRGKDMDDKFNGICNQLSDALKKK